MSPQYQAGVKSTEKVEVSAESVKWGDVAWTWCQYILVPSAKAPLESHSLCPLRQSWRRMRVDYQHRGPNALRSASAIPTFREKAETGPKSKGSAGWVKTKIWGERHHATAASGSIIWKH